MELFKPGRTFDFMGQRWFWIPFSLLLVVLSTILAFYPGPNYGTDFRGGTEIEVAFKGLPTFEGTKGTEAVRKAVEASGFSAPDVVQVGAEDKQQYLVRVADITVITDELKGRVSSAMCLTDDPSKPPADEARCPKEARATEVKFSAGGDKILARYETDPDLSKIRDQIATVQDISLRASPTNPRVSNPRDHRVEIQLQSQGDKLMAKLKERFPEVAPEDALRVEWVGPKAGKQLRDSARNSVVIAVVFIMLYLAFRFDLRFSPGVVVACVHDAMVVIGVFVLFKREVTLSTIAAILTIVGYSMNDTVVVYDRIRENLGKYKGKSFADVINMSVSETLSRTILTSVSSLLSVLAFLFLGTGVIQDFALAMTVGIVAGTYSSIYVAAPLTEWIDAKMARKDDVKRRLQMR